MDEHGLWKQTKSSKEMKRPRINLHVVTFPGKHAGRK